MDRYLQDLLESGTPTGRMPLQGIDTPVRAPIPQQDPNSFAAPTRTKAAQNVLRTALGLNTPGSFTQKAMELLSGLQELNDPAGGVGPSKAILAGVKASGAPLEDILRARMFGKGLNEPSQNLWKTQKVAFGKEGNPRWEIPDTASKLSLREFNQSEAFPEYWHYKTLRSNRPTMGDILYHPDLYKAYPEIADYPVKGVGLNWTISGAFNPEEKIFHISGGRPKDIQSVLLHEAQHAVQNLEGFPQGAASHKWLSPTHSKDVYELGKLINQFIDRNPYDIVAAYRKSKKGWDAPTAGVDWDQGSKSIMQEIHNSNDPQTLLSLIHKLTKYHQAERIASKKYQRTPGEVEARNVQARFENPELMNFAPVITEDVPRPLQRLEYSNR